MEEERQEIIISSARDVDGPWKEYGFPVKPGDVTRPPRWISPWHYRLDWQLWIAAVSGPVERSPWLFGLMLKMLERDETVLGPLGVEDPWKGEQDPPRYIRADLYRYEFHRSGGASKETTGGVPPYWNRTFVKRFYPTRGVETIASLRERVQRMR